MSNQNPQNDGIEIPEEELSGEPGDEVPGLETQEAGLGVTGETLEVKQKIVNLEREIDELSPEQIPTFIKKLGQEMNNDPIIKRYPELRLDYLNVRQRALEQAGIKVLEILTPPGQKPIDPVIADVKKAKDMNALGKKYYYTKALGELKVIANAYSLHLADPKILPAQKEKINADLQDIKEYWQNLKKLSNASIH